MHLAQQPLLWVLELECAMGRVAVETTTVCSLGAHWLARFVAFVIIKRKLIDFTFLFLGWKSSLFAPTWKRFFLKTWSSWKRSLWTTLMRGSVSSRST